MLVVFFKHTTSYIKILKKIYMVITTHMYNQMVLENQKKYNSSKVPKNPEAAFIKSFLTDSTDITEIQKRAISSNS